MCGRFAISNRTNEYIEELAEAHGFQVLKHLADYFPRYNIAPTDQVPVLYRSAGEPAGVLTTARWWLVGSRAKALNDTPGPTFNARMESAVISERNGRPSMWSGPLSRGQRCLIPASGYYEWTGPKNDRTPHWIHPDGPALMFAGLYNWWTDPAKPKDDPSARHLTCTVFTMPTVPELAGIHDRNPMAIPEPLWWDWIDPSVKGDQTLVDAMAHASQPVMAGLREHVVGKIGPKSEGPELIEPASLF